MERFNLTAKDYERMTKAQLMELTADTTEKLQIAEAKVARLTAENQALSEALKVSIGMVEDLMESLERHSAKQDELIEQLQKAIAEA